MEQMTTTVQQTASNAKLANDLAFSARAAAENGAAVVNKAVNAMAEITNSSQKINSIIELINSIAFQTNLLALNASVKRHAPVIRAAVSRSSPTKCASLQAAAPARRKRSRN